MEAGESVGNDITTHLSLTSIIREPDGIVVELARACPSTSKGEVDKYATVPSGATQAAGFADISTPTCASRKLFVVPERPSMSLASNYYARAP